MKLEKYNRCCIVTNTMSDELYNMSRSFYDKVGIDMKAISGKNRMYSMNFLNALIMDTKFDYDWVILIDEDCFITDTSAMLSLLDYQMSAGKSACGMPDGGVISHRFHNPISINTFFTILNMKWIRSVYAPIETMSSSYMLDLDKFVPRHLLNKTPVGSRREKIVVAEGYVPYSVKYDNFEPYYTLFFYILRKGGNILYLDANDYLVDGDTLDGGTTTVLKNHEGVTFAYHTWFAREYQNPETRARINYIYDYCKSIAK